MTGRRCPTPPPAPGIRGTAITFGSQSGGFTTHNLGLNRITLAHQIDMAAQTQIAASPPRGPGVRGPAQRPGNLPATASSRASYRPGDRLPHQRAHRAQQPRYRDGPPRRYPPPAAPRQDIWRADHQAAPAHAPAYLRHHHAGRESTCGMCRSLPATPTRGRPCVMTGPARTLTATPTTSWPPTLGCLTAQDGRAWSVGGWSRMAATASCWLSRDPAANA
jgi:hypothetical protein